MSSSTAAKCLQEPDVLQVSDRSDVIMKLFTPSFSPLPLFSLPLPPLPLPPLPLLSFPFPRLPLPLLPLSPLPLLPFPLLSLPPLPFPPLPLPRLSSLPPLFSSPLTSSTSFCHFFPLLLRKLHKSSAYRHLMLYCLY